MKKNYKVWKLSGGYLLFLVLLIISGSAQAQSPCEGDDCNTKFIDIQKDTKASAKYKVVVVPTILIFSGDEEVGRFQANIMMQMEAKQKDIQGKIDEIIMEGF